MDYLVLGSMGPLWLEEGYDFAPMDLLSNLGWKWWAILILSTLIIVSHVILALIWWWGWKMTHYSRKTEENSFTHSENIWESGKESRTFFQVPPIYLDDQESYEQRFHSILKDMEDFMNMGRIQQKRIRAYIRGLAFQQEELEVLMCRVQSKVRELAQLRMATGYPVRKTGRKETSNVAQQY